MERESGRFDVFCRNMRSAALERSSAVEIIHNNCIDLDRTSEHKNPTTLDDETKKNICTKTHIIPSNFVTCIATTMWRCGRVTHL